MSGKGYLSTDGPVRSIIPIPGISLHEAFCSEMTERGEDFLFRLPDALSFDIIYAWLYLVEVVRLDSACCERVQRQHLLDHVFRSPQFLVGDGAEELETTNRYISWIHMRGIASQDLLITYEVDPLLYRLYLQKFGQSIKRLILMDLPTVDALLLVPLYCPNIQSLICKFSKLSEVVVDVLSQCKELKHLQFIGCDETWSAYSNFSNLPKLSHLCLETINLDRYNDEQNMARVSSMVLTLNVPTHTTRLNLDTMSESAFSLIRNQLFRYTNLRTLGLAMVEFLDDDTLSQIVASCPNIMHLDVTSCSKLTDMSVVALARHLTQLRSLCISYVSITDVAMEALVKHRHDTLEVLFCAKTEITSPVFNSLLRACTKLHTVDLVNDDATADELDWSLMVHITTLHLSLSANDNADYCSFFTSMASHCRQLTHLYLSYMHPECTLPFLELSAANLPALRFFSVWRDIEVYDEEEPPDNTQNDKLIQELSTMRPELEIRIESDSVDFDVMTLDV